MKTNKDLRRRETDKLGEWIQQAALDDANKRIAELEAMMQWQSIDTAPTTGRQLFLLFRVGGFPYLAYSDTWWSCGFSAGMRPTHWLQIPPAAAKEGE